MLPEYSDVVIVGAGNAAFCAGLAAAEHGCSVLVLERAPEAEAGGNSRFTAGAMRCVYDGVDDLKALMPDLSEAEIANTDFGTYTEEKFFDDMGRVTEYRTDPDLCELLVKRSRETMRWMHGKGVRFQPIYGRQAFKVDGKFKFWGGLTVEVWGGGPGLVQALTDAARKNKIEIAYAARTISLRRGQDRHRRARARYRRRGHPRPLCRGRNGRRAVLFQLSRRHRADGRRGVRKNRRRVRRQARGAYALSQFPSRSRLTISRITSLVPSRIWCTRTSRSTRSIG